MAVNTKNKRKIIVNEKQYVWSVGLDQDSPYYLCNIVSSDKSLVISLPLQTGTHYVISKGRVFQNKESMGAWQRYALPFNIPEIITPAFISKVIEWITKCDDAVCLDYNGDDVPL